MRTKAIHLHSPTPSRGFTLTELLVVILIIAVLAALSITGVQRMRSSADKVTSARSLNQLQIANTAYASDHNGNYVPIIENDDKGTLRGRWYQNQEYLKFLIGDMLDASGIQVKAVPPSLLDPKVYRARGPFYQSMAASFGMTDNGVGGQGTVPNAAPSHNINRIPNPSQSMVFATSTDFRVTYNSRFNYKDGDTKTSDGAMAYRHNKKALVVYFDGHIGELSKGDIKQIDDSRGGKNSAFWKPTAQ